MKTRSTKKALLASLLSLAVCVSLLVGSTFAWFTDSVTSAQNVIQSGNLDVELYYADKVTADDNGNDTTVWKPVTSSTDIYGYNLWEPGYTKVAYFKVVNEGSLALKYTLSADVYNETAGVNQAGESFLLSDYLKTSLVNVGVTRDDVLALDGVALKDSFAMSGEEHLTAGASKVVGMAIWMPTTVGNVANHNGTDVPAIEFGINLFATQFTAEEDSFDNQYDKDAVYYEARVTTAAELETAVKAGKKVIAVDGTIALTKGFNANGVKFIGMSDGAAIDFGTNGISGNKNTFENLTLDNERSGFYQGMQYSDAENTTYKNCVIANGLTTYGNTTLIGCTFKELPAGNYALWLYDGTTHKVEDCVFEYGNRAIKIYNEGPLDVELAVSNTMFKASETSVANKAMIEIDDTNLSSVKVTVDDIAVDVALAAQGVYRINDGALDTSTAKSQVTVDGVKNAASSASGLKAGATAGVSEIVLTDKITAEDVSYINFTQEATVTGGTISRDTASGNPLLVNTTNKVTFEDVEFVSEKGQAVLSTRKVGASIEVNNCTFTNFAAPSTGNTGVQVYANNVTMVFNGCTFNNMPIETNSSYPEGIKLVFNNCTFNWKGDNCPGMLKLANHVKAEVDFNDCTFAYKTDSQYTSNKNFVTTYINTETAITFNNTTVIGERNNSNIWKLCYINPKSTATVTGTNSYTFNGQAVDFDTYFK